MGESARAEQREQQPDQVGLPHGVDHAGEGARLAENPPQRKDGDGELESGNEDFLHARRLALLEPESGSRSRQKDRGGKAGSISPPPSVILSGARYERSRRTSALVHAYSGGADQCTPLRLDAFACRESGIVAKAERVPTRRSFDSVALRSG